MTPEKVTPLKDVKSQIKSQLAETKKNEDVQKFTTDTEDFFKKKVAYAVGFAPPDAATETTSTSG